MLTGLLVIVALVYLSRLYRGNGTRMTGFDEFSRIIMRLPQKVCFNHKMLYKIHSR